MCFIECAASLLPAACFVGVCLAGCDRNAAVALMTLGTMFMAGMYCGFLSNHIDIASNYAGTLMALTNTFATIPGFIVPVFVGELTHGNVIIKLQIFRQLFWLMNFSLVFFNQQTLERWQIIFGTTAVIQLIELIVFSSMASGEEQAWNRAFTSGDLHKTEAGEPAEHEKLRPKESSK